MNQDKPEGTERREILDIEIPDFLAKKGITQVVLVNRPERLPDGTIPGFSQLFLRLYGDKIAEQLLGPNPFDAVLRNKDTTNEKPG